MTQDTITLRPDLRESLARNAQEAARTLSDLVNEAVESYLEARQNEKLDREVAAYTRLHAELWNTMPGEWVAIHKQQLVDQDTDQLALYRRVRSTYGATPIFDPPRQSDPTERYQLEPPVQVNNSNEIRLRPRLSSSCPYRRNLDRSARTGPDSWAAIGNRRHWRRWHPRTSTFDSRTIFAYCGGSEDAAKSVGRTSHCTHLLGGFESRWASSARHRDRR